MRAETLRRARIGFTAEPKLTRYIVRLWITGTDPVYADTAIAMAVDLAKRENSTEAAAAAIATHVEGITAVEVLDGDLNGNLIRERP